MIFKIALNIFYQQQNSHRREVPKQRPHFLLKNQNPILVKCPLLIITIGGTKDLPRFGNYNVVVEVDSQRFETPILRETGAPVFNQQFACSTFVGCPYVKVTLQYEKIFKTSKAYCHLSLSQLEEAEPLPLAFPACTHRRFSGWLQLLRYNNNDGRIFIEADVFSPTGDDPKEVLRRSKGMIDSKGMLKEGVIIAPKNSPSKRQPGELPPVSPPSSGKKQIPPKNSPHNESDASESQHQSRSRKSNRAKVTNSNTSEAQKKNKKNGMIDLLCMDDIVDLQAPSKLLATPEEPVVAFSVPQKMGSRSPTTSDSSTRLKIKKSTEEIPSVVGATASEVSSKPVDPFAAFDVLLAPRGTPAPVIEPEVNENGCVFDDVSKSVPTPIAAPPETVLTSSTGEVEWNPFGHPTQKVPVPPSNKNVMDINFDPFSTL